MTNLAHNVETRLFYGSHGMPAASDVEPVIVTPCKTSSEFGSAAIRDRVFAAHCEFSWRTETVYAPSGDGARKLAFKRFRQTAGFERATLHNQFPGLGDRVTRSWDGATFQISAVYAQAGTILCDLVEIPAQVQ